MNKKLSSLFVILAGVLWGIISIFVNYLADNGFSSVEICFARIFSCAIMLFLFLLCYKKELLKIAPRDIWMFVGTGIVSLTLFSLCYFTTIIKIDASVAVSLLYTSPVFIMLLSALLFKEKITSIRVVSIIMTVVGCALVSGFAGAKSGVGVKSIIIGIEAGLFYALYSIFARYALKKYHPLTINFYTFLFSSIAFSIIVKPNGITHIACAKSMVLFVMVLSGFLCGVLPYLFYTSGLKGLDTSVAGVLVAVEPLVGAVVGIVGFKESSSPMKILGIALILSAIVISSLVGKEEKKPNGN